MTCSVSRNFFNSCVFFMPSSYGNGKITIAGKYSVAQEARNDGHATESSSCGAAMPMWAVAARSKWVQASTGQRGTLSSASVVFEKSHNGPSLQFVFHLRFTIRA